MKEEPGLRVIEGGNEETTTSFRIPQDLKSTIEEYCKREGLSASAFYRLAAQGLLNKEGREENLWQLGDAEEWDYTKIYGAASDKNGHYRHLRVNVPPYLADVVGRIIARRGLPYTSLEGFVRDAMVHRSKQLENLYPNEELSMAVAIQHLLEEELVTKQERDSFHSLVEQMQANFEAYLQAGQIGRAKRWLGDKEVAISSIPAHYQEQYETLILEMYQKIKRRED